MKGSFATSSVARTPRLSSDDELTIPCSPDDTTLALPQDATVVLLPDAKRAIGSAFLTWCARPRVRALVAAAGGSFVTSALVTHLVGGGHRRVPPLAPSPLASVAPAVLAIPEARRRPTTESAALFLLTGRMLEAEEAYGALSGAPDAGVYRVVARTLRRERIAYGSGGAP